MNLVSDPRPIYRGALHWVSGLMSEVRADQLPLPTPCPEFTVRRLLGHLVGTAERSLATAQHRDTRAIPHVVDSVPDAGLAARYAALADQADAAWAACRLEEPVRAPWGQVSAEQAVWGFAMETLVHGWDVAVATGQPPEGPERCAEPLLQRAREIVPAAGRRAYAAPATPPDAAGPTARLAAWLGRSW